MFHKDGRQNSLRIIHDSDAEHLVPMVGGTTRYNHHMHYMSSKSNKYRGKVIAPDLKDRPQQQAASI
jgi:hypothetical protein